MHCYSLIFLQIRPSSLWPNLPVKGSCCSLKSAMDPAAATLARMNSASLASTSNPKLDFFYPNSTNVGAVCSLKSATKLMQGRRHNGLKIYASLQEATKVNGVKINGTKVEKLEGANLVAKDQAIPLDLQMKNPAFSTLIAAIARIAVAAQKQRRFERVNGKTEVPVDALRQGRLVEGRLVYRQTFVIRSYEVGADRTASVETLMNHFQETALNHVWMSGLAGDGFGATHQMILSNLIWVVTRMHVQVERYPSWGDVVELDTWVTASGKNGMRRDWLVRDYKSGQILARATSTWVMMNKTTRRLSKMPDGVRAEISPYYLQRSAIVEEASQKIDKLDDTAQLIRSGLMPRHGDLDMNQHVNNVKYIGWMLESLPTPVHSGHELASMTLEYRKECGQNDVVQSMASPEFPLEATSLDPCLKSSNVISAIGPLKFFHLLRLQVDGSEIVRGRTIWRLKARK